MPSLGIKPVSALKRCVNYASMEYSAVSIFTGNAELALNLFFFPPPEVIGRSPYFNTAAL